MTDPRVMSFLNLFAILGALEPLCELVPEAENLVANKCISIGFLVKNGPSAALAFDHGRCRLRSNADPCDIKLSFSSPEKFNGLIEGTITPIPRKGFTKLGFLLKEFTALTGLLTRYLRDKPEEHPEDPLFFTRSTALLFYVVTAAISQVGNQDTVGRFSAGNMVDGTILVRVPDGPSAGISVKNHILTTMRGNVENPRAYMEFQSMALARDLFDGRANAVACVGEGQIRVGGMISMVDNMNRILDRVSLYLA